ncbi:MAG: anthranilate synthase component I [Elusimicrobia bacterium]|nr:anthranilate synthase component I [Elusimicrobiota bacterium]
MVHLFPSFPAVKKLAAAGNLIPVYKEIVADTETPVSTFLKLAAGEPYSYLLESVEGGERWARYSFISWAPKRIFISKGKQFSVTAPGKAPQWQSTEDPLASLKELMENFKPVSVEGLPRFWGGAVGYATYDVVRCIEQLPNKPPEKLTVPDMLFFITDQLVIFDHLSHSVKILKCIDTGASSDLRGLYDAAEQDIDKIIVKLRLPLKLAPVKKHAHQPQKSNMTPRAYCETVSQAKKYIRAGDIIQVVPSQRFSRRTGADSFDIYRALRLVNPSPYLYHITAGDFSVIGSSPELLVRKEGEHAETRPIAGTRPRSKDAATEEALARELLADPKERAEHIMLVDLGRNDLGRVCKPTTIAIPELMIIEKYSHVMHIVSSVTGTLNPGVDAFELFRACFPAGTVSGAPKIRAMEIIDELEPVSRGIYAGAVGYFSFSGNMDMAITIRTIVLKDGIAYAQAGGGVVADSVPLTEYQETRNKAAGLFAAIDRAENGL